MKKLTGGQIAVLILATAPMVVVGIGGAIGTYTNAASVLADKGSALGFVAAGEGATLVAALVMIVVTMFGQPAPTVVRVALWALPLIAAAMGFAIAPTVSDAAVFAFTPLAITASAESISLLARRTLTYRTEDDVEAQRRNATVMRQIAYHRARAEKHPWKWVRKRSTLKVWRLLSRAGADDMRLGAGLVEVQREQLTEIAEDALGELLTTTPAQPELPPAQPTVSREPEPGEPEPVDYEETVNTALPAIGSEPRPMFTDPVQLHVQPAGLPVSREPVLSPAEPTRASRAEPSPEPDSETTETERGVDDEIEQQITKLAQRLRRGDRLTKTTAAQLLGVSPATAGRRLKDARARINEGTGFYP